MMIKTIQGWRRIARILHAILILSIPFFRIKGESLLRFDIPSQRLYFFGKDFWMNEFFIVLIALLFFTFLIIFVTVLFGRIWCGWLCPQTVISDMTAFTEKTYKKGSFSKLFSYIAVFLLSILISASLIWYFVSPYEFFQTLMAWQMGKVIWGFWIVLTVILFINFTLIRRRFCATVCPYARMQGMLFDQKTLIIAFDSRREEECMDCKACVQVCPVGIDIRKGANIACINCAECVDKCGEIFRRKGKRGLINYFFGAPGSEGSIIRQNVIITGILTLCTLLLLVYLGSSRRFIDIIIIPDPNFQPRYTERNELINSFIISIENRDERDQLIYLMPLGNLRIVPDQIPVKGGELKRTKVFLASRDLSERVILNFITKDGILREEVTLVRP